MISTHEIEFYKSIIDELNIVFDVGCQHDNIFYDLKPEIEVHLFDPAISGRLQNKIVGKPNVYYNNIALGNKKEQTVFHPAYGSILLRDDEPLLDGFHAETFIEMDTAWNYCSEKGIEKIDFLKIDTEGFDFEVIKGCGEMIKNIKYIQFEDWNKDLTRQIIYYLKPKVLNILNSKPKNYIATL